MRTGGDLGSDTVARRVREHIPVTAQRHHAVRFEFLFVAIDLLDLDNDTSLANLNRSA